MSFWWASLGFPFFDISFSVVESKLLLDQITGRSNGTNCFLSPDRKSTFFWPTYETCWPDSVLNRQGICSSWRHFFLTLIFHFRPSPPSREAPQLSFNSVQYVKELKPFFIPLPSKLHMGMLTPADLIRYQYTVFQRVTRTGTTGRGYQLPKSFWYRFLIQN